MRGARPHAAVLFVQLRSTLPFLILIRVPPFRRQEMPGPVRADGLFFACAKSKRKSTHKRGSTPLMELPGKAPDPSQAETTRMSALVSTCFLGQTSLVHSTRARSKTPPRGCSIEWDTRPGGGVLTRGRRCCPSCGVRRAAVPLPINHLSLMGILKIFLNLGSKKAVAGTTAFYCVECCKADQTLRF